MAERNAELVPCLGVQCHRLEVIHPCRVHLPVVLEDGANVGIVDGLPHRAVQAPFACQCHAQRTVGTLVVAQRKVGVPQSVERHHAVLPGGERRVGTLLAQLPCTVMVFLRHVQHAHAPVVGADVVQCLYQFQRVACSLSQLLPGAVHAQGFLEAALVAQSLAPLSQGNDAAEPLARPFQLLLQQRKRVYAVHRAHYAVRLPAFFGGESRWFLPTRTNEEEYRDQRYRCTAQQVAQLLPAPQEPATRL